MYVSRRTFMAAAMMTGLGLAGCSAGGTNLEGSAKKKTTKKKTKKEGEIGKPVSITTDAGELEVTAEGFDVSESFGKEWDDQLKDGYRIGLLLLIVKNVSYNEYTDDYISLDSTVYCEDENGVGMNVMDTSNDYGEYKGAAGAFFELPEGRSMRVALLYHVPEDIQKVTAVLGETRIPIETRRCE